MNIADYSIEKKIVMGILVLLLLAGGWFGYINSGRLEDPEFTIREVKVYTPYPGATPDEVEKEVSDLIESAAQKLAKVERVESESSNGLSNVSVIFFDEGTSKQEMRQLYDELRRKINDVQRQLPPGAGPSLVNDDFGDVYGIFYAITGDGFTDRELYVFAEELQKTLLLVEGVAKVELWGQPKEVVYVEIPRSKIVEMELSQQMLAQLIQDQNIVVESGDLLIGGERPLFRITGGYGSVEDIGNIRIPSQENAGLSQITLSDIAEIYRGYEEPRTNQLRFNGRKGIGLAVSAITTENVVEVGKRLDDTIRIVMEQTPIGIEVGKIFNQPDAVQVAVNNFVMSLFQSVAIVIGLLVIFMGLQSGLIIGFMLLLIIAGTLFFMNLFNITLQRISLGALIIAMGMLVDNSIVITEGILVRTKRGEGAQKAASAVVGQTMWPLFGATIVAIFAFAAVGMSPDGSGEYTQTLFWVIIISLTLSWFLAITVNPLICTVFMKPQTEKNQTKKNSRFPRLSAFLAKITPQSEGSLLMSFFEKVLRFSLERSRATLLIVGGILILTVLGFTLVTQAFFPNSGQPQFLVDYFLSEGTDITVTARDVVEIEARLMDKDQFPEISKLSAYVGASPPRFQLTFAPEPANPRFGQFLIEVENPEDINSVLPRVQSMLDEEFPQGMGQAYRFQLGPGTKGLVQVRVQGSDPLMLRQIAQDIKEIMYETGNAIAIKDDWGDRAKIVTANVNERAAREVGITRSMVSNALQHGFNGMNVGLYRERNRLLPIISRLPFTDRSDPASLYDMYIWSPVLNGSIPISQVVDSFEFSYADTRIQRRDRRSTITVSCDPRSGEASELFNAIKTTVENLELPQGYYVEWGGQAEDSANANEGIAKTFPLAFLAMLLTIFVLWNKVRQPIIIFLSIPLSLVGVVAGLLLTGLPFSFMALMGLLALFGMVIKNAIVMVDEIDLTLTQGGDAFEGIIQASSSRVRPVMMAALSTVLGMAPLLSDLFFQGMAITVMGGLTVASLITLIVTPVLYKEFFKIQQSVPETKT
ncbi:MAG: efflux RND transporter permease subunit [Spirochaetales bacterium]|nr:efflux RND transporter permease subunit [Spirochaetales bacterium]